jgi:hypothetical protein
MRTNGCFYDQDNKGCTMCDFKRYAIKQPVKSEWLMKQFETVLVPIKEDEQIEQIDLLTLGSFLHDKEVPLQFQQEVMSMISNLKSIKKVVIESRTSYVSLDKLLFLKSFLRRDQILELSVGVETSNDRLRQNVIRKGMSWSDLERTVRFCSEAGIQFQAYLLIGTQTLSVSDRISDAIQSAYRIAELCNRHNVVFRIAFEPVFITKGTELEELYINGKYTLVNLWEIVQVLKQTYHLGTIFVGLSDEGLSNHRIPKSCIKCNDKLIEAIDSFNALNEFDVFENIECNCFVASS